MIIETIKIQEDGEELVATYSDFKNLQESSAGYGLSVEEAVSNLFENDSKRASRGI